MSGFQRKQSRAEARRYYNTFSKIWRRDMRLAGLYGKKTQYKKPTFSQWVKMHESNNQMMEQSTPQDVQEHMGLDPWAEQLDPRVSEQFSSGPKKPEQERGVTTIDIVADEED